MRIIIDHELYGERTEFETLAEAQAALRDCDSGSGEWAGITLRIVGDAVRNEDGAEVGQVVRDENTQPRLPA